MHKKKVAIIGANGFIGISISEALSKKGYKVYGFIRNEKSSYENIYKNLKINTIVVGDLEEIKNINLQGNKFDYIINLAARAHITQDLSKKGNKVIKSLNNIERNIVKNFDVKNVKLIQLSSAKVKLNRTSLPMSDSELIYINAKLKSENIIRQNFEKYIILRPPLIYGPYVKANFLALIKAIDFGLPLPFLNLENFRSYLYLENLVDLILKVIEENKFLNNFYYVCDGNAVSTKHLSDLIANHLSKKPLYFYINKNLLYFLAKVIKKQSLLNKVIGDFIINNNKINKDVGWAPKYNLNLGIKNTCFWYKTMFKMKN